MNNNETYAVRVLWGRGYVTNDFFIMWSDHTWDRYEIDPKKYGGLYIRVDGVDTTIRKHMNLVYLVQKKLNKEDSLKYINEQLKKIES